MGEQRSAASAADSAGPFPGGWLGYDRLSGPTESATDEQSVMEVAVRVAADRAIRVWWHGLVGATAAGDRARVRLREGEAVLQVRERSCPVPGAAEEVTALVHLTPSPGEHVYAVSVERASGSGGVHVVADPAYPSELIVEDVGPAPS